MRVRALESLKARTPIGRRRWARPSARFDFLVVDLLGIGPTIRPSKGLRQTLLRSYPPMTGRRPGVAGSIRNAMWRVVHSGERFRPCERQQ